MVKKELDFTEMEVVERKGKKVKRYPNLSTVLMVEDFLKKNRDMPMKISEIKEKLPRKVMHQTLMVILEYLWRSGKIIYGPRGVQWIYASREHLERMLKGALEV